MFKSPVIAIINGTFYFITLSNSILMIKNIFDLPSELPSKDNEELFETIVSGKNILIERIISNGQKSPKTGWYEQEKDEIVFLLKGKAKIEFENKKTFNLQEGDYLQIKSGIKHKVIETSENPPCIWLAIHSQQFLG